MFITRPHLHSSALVFLSILLLIAPQANCDRSATSSYDQFLESTPKIFGLYLLANQNNNNNEELTKKLDSYAMMQCELLAEIVVVMGKDRGKIEQDGNWKRAVLFVEGEGEGFRMPGQTGVSVYFVVGLDVSVGCEEMVAGFSIWREKAVGDIGPLMTYSSTGFDFNLKTQSFIPTDPQQSRFFNINELSAGWVSKFYFELLSAKSIPEVEQIQKVASTEGCHGLALNFVIGYYFPEMLPGVLSGDLTVLPGKSKKEGMSVDCMDKFVDILGYNPLRVVNKADPPNPQRFASQTASYIIYLKRMQLESRLKSLTVEALLPTGWSAQENNLREELSTLKIQISRIQMNLEGKGQGKGKRDTEEGHDGETDIDYGEIGRIGVKVKAIKVMGFIIVVFLAFMILHLMIYCLCRSDPKQVHKDQQFSSSDSD